VHELVEGLTVRLIKECKSVELSNEVENEDGSCTFNLDCTDEEASRLFSLGLQDLAGAAYKVLPIHQFEKDNREETPIKSIEITDALWEYCINAGVISAIKKGIEELENGRK